MLSTIENFEKAKVIIRKIDQLNFHDNKELTSIYKIDNQVSLWELAKPVLNIHVIPGIISKNKSYRLTSLVLKKYYSLLIFLKLKKDNSSKIQLLEDNVNYFICFTKYMYNDIVSPFMSKEHSKNYTTISTDIIDKKVINIKNFWNASFHKEAKMLIRQLSTTKHIYTLFKYRKLISQSNIHFFDFIKIHMWLTGYFLNTYVSYIILAKNFIKNNKIKNILELDIADPRSRIFTLYANNNNIKTYTVQFAFYYRDSYEWYYSKSDFIFTWGNWFDKVFIDYYGIDPTKIKVTGSPRFDKYLLKTNITFKETYQNSVLIISSYDIPAYNKITNTISFKVYLEKIIIILLKHNYKIYIKTHPLEKDIKYLYKYKDQGLEIIEIDDFDKILSNSDFVISHGSSLTFSALISKKPILFPTSKNIVWWDDVFANNSLGVGFDSYSAFEELLNNKIYINEQIDFNKNLLESFIYFDFNESSSNKINKHIN